MKDEKLMKKWRSAKAKAVKWTAVESELRLQISIQMSKEGEEKAAVPFGEEKIIFTRQENYSIPKAAIPAIESNLKKKLFESLFTVSYSLKVPVYKELDEASKKVIDAHLTIKPAPLKVEIKEA